VRRTRVAIVLGFAAFFFLGITLLLARGLTGGNAERSEVLDVLRAQARGDARAVLEHLPACRAVPACASTTRDRVAGLRRPGAVEILNFKPSATLTLTRQTGTARVAWRAGTGLPVVQCVRVRRHGPLTGGHVELLSLSAPIPGESGCSD
jgi:hypothetical protein